MTTSNSALKFAERGLIPDTLVRKGIQNLVKTRLKEISASDCEAGMTHLTQFVTAMNQSKIAEVPELANAQHYEVPAEFFHLCLGKHLGLFGRVYQHVDVLFMLLRRRIC